MGDPLAIPAGAPVEVVTGVAELQAAAAAVCSEAVAGAWDGPLAALADALVRVGRGEVPEVPLAGALATG